MLAGARRQSPRVDRRRGDGAAATFPQAGLVTTDQVVVVQRIEGSIG